MLRTRLILGLLPLLLLFFAIGGYALKTCYELGASVESMLGRNFRALRSAQDMREAATAMSNSLALARRGDVLGGRTAFETGRSRFQRAFNDEALATPPGDARARLLSMLDEHFREFTAIGNQELRDQAGDSLSSLNASETALFAVTRAISALLESDYVETRATEIGARLLTRDRARLLMAAMVAAVLLFFYLALRLSRSLMQPIQTLTVAAVALGEGDLDHDAPVLAKDELGDLARAFNTMAAKLRVYRERTTQKMLRAQRIMESTLTSVPDPVFLVASDHSLELKNPAAEKLTAALDPAGHFPPAVREPLDQVLATGHHYLPTGYDRLVALRDGREDRYFLPRILAIGDPLTGFGGAAVILQDVTKFRLLDDAKSNLVGTVSHELKTPLTSLRMAVYLLLEQNVGKLSPKQTELLEQARDDADRLLRILNDLLDLSRLESGAAALSLRPEPVRPLLEAMAREVQGLVGQAGQRLTVQCADHLPPVRADQDRLRHAFINLLTNASKYSPEGGGITLYAAPAADGFVTFGVRDHGPGIPAESLPHLFDRFYRVPGQKKKGAGVGLAIAREIVVAHGGSIGCSSRPGEGSDFYFLIPQSA